MQFENILPEIEVFNPFVMAAIFDLKHPYIIKASQKLHVNYIHYSGVNSLWLKLWEKIT